VRSIRSGAGVLGTKGSTVRLGISAPRDVAVYRKEVWDRMVFVVDAEGANAAAPVLPAEYTLPPR
jgi:sRNA-binding carbon storage regulator CsrA